MCTTADKWAWYGWNGLWLRHWGRAIQWERSILRAGWGPYSASSSLRSILSLGIGSRIISDEDKDYLSSLFFNHLPCDCPEDDSDEDIHGFSEKGGLPNWSYLAASQQKYEVSLDDMDIIFGKRLLDWARFILTKLKSTLCITPGDTLASVSPLQILELLLYEETIIPVLDVSSSALKSRENPEIFTNCQERPHEYGNGYDLCSEIMTRVECNTPAVTDETHGWIHVCQNRYPWVFGITKIEMCCHHGSRVWHVYTRPWPRYIVSAAPVGWIWIPSAVLIAFWSLPFGNGSRAVRFGAK